VNIVKVLATLIAGGSALLGIELHEHINSPRWAVKTLGDGYELPAATIQTTIEEQCSLPVQRVEESTYRLNSEKQLVHLSANLIEAKREFDGDYHLVLEDPVTKLHMIAEIPDTSGKASRENKQRFVQARKMIDGIAGAPGMLALKYPKPVSVEITGLGFFDEPHMVTPKGMPENFREIHPVIQVRILNTEPS
jgi:hypothetical protein